MITRETIQDIYDSVKIEEVIGEFVTLRKRGANHIGLCPFHNEKTPSFTVSQSKGIYKCFGCGEGGGAVDFLMKHEHYTYPEALRWLANKFGIAIEEKEETDEQKAERDERESIFVLNSFAEKFFINRLTETDEGKSIALGYCRKREISDLSIKKFNIGYSPAKSDAFSSNAMNQGYKKEQLIKSGLSVDRNGLLFDRFRERLIFPIHNISGRVIGYGGRVLTSDPNKPKYLNSPESEIYNKSKVLYGLYQGRSAIASKDNCYIVEGYTDVIALHQAGIENVVSSSGTSLTEDQIRIIKRFTQNITMIFDGDPAGIKASFRGIDMILKQGLHVKIIPMPENEDPDTFSKSRRSAEVESYFEKQAENVITFKANLLMGDAGNDPVKRAGVIKDILSSISLIPDQLERSLFIKECSEITDMEEQKLTFELNKLIRQNRTKEAKRGEGYTDYDVVENNKQTKPLQETKEEAPVLKAYEYDIIRILINYGSIIIKEDDDDKDNDKTTTVAHNIVSNLMDDNIEFEDPIFQAIFTIYKDYDSDGSIPGHELFIRHDKREIANVVIEMLSSPHQLSENWQKRRKIDVPLEEDLILTALRQALLSYRLKMVEVMYHDNSKQLSLTKDEEEIQLIMHKQKKLLMMRHHYAKELGRIVTR